MFCSICIGIRSKLVSPLLYSDFSLIIFYPFSLKYSFIFCSFIFRSFTQSLAFIPYFFCCSFPSELLFNNSFLPSFCCYFCICSCSYVNVIFPPLLTFILFQISFLPLLFYFYSFLFHLLVFCTTHHIFPFALFNNFVLNFIQRGFILC